MDCTAQANTIAKRTLKVERIPGETDHVLGKSTYLAGGGFLRR
jgi:hypothetical protein